MDIKTIPLARLEENLEATLRKCADSGVAVVVELPDQRLVSIQMFDPDEDDSLIDDLLETNEEFRKLVEQSKVSPRKPFFTG